MEPSIIYRSPFLYSFFIKLLYRRNYRARFEAISEEIEDGASVLDLCCGDCALYTMALQNRVDYCGVDFNPVFIERARKRSIPVINLDITKEPLPPADYTVMQASLYQFIPRHKEIVDRMIESAQQATIISEPIRNIADSKNPLIAFIARYSTNPGTGHAPARFTEERFRAFIEEDYRNRIRKFKYIKGKRELIVVLNAKTGSAGS